MGMCLCLSTPFALLRPAATFKPQYLSAQYGLRFDYSKLISYMHVMV